MEKKYLVSFFVLTAAVVFLSGCASRNGQQEVAPAEDNSSLIFFYGKECPHCKNVEEFFEENKVAEKVQFSQKEVYHNKANAAPLAEKAKVCSIPEDNIGVPLLWNDGQCVVGDEPIIKFFRDKINSNQK